MYYKTKKKQVENNKIDIKTTFLIVYLASKISNLYITKLLKLLYIIDEAAVKETGVSITSLDYNVWQHGPVNTEIYNKLNFNLDDNLFNYISIRENKLGKIITNIEKFQDDEFSDYEIELIDKTVEQYGKLSSNQLIEILHKQGSLWDKIVKEKNLDEKFKFSEVNTSPYKINFEDLLKNDSLKHDIYKTSLESINFQQTFEAFA